MIREEAKYAGKFCANARTCLSESGRRRAEEGGLDASETETKSSLPPRKAEIFATLDSLDQTESSFLSATRETPGSYRAAALLHIANARLSILDSEEIAALLVSFENSEYGDDYHRALDLWKILKPAMHFGGPVDAITVRAARAYADACERGRADFLKGQSESVSGGGGAVSTG